MSRDGGKAGEGRKGKEAFTGGHGFGGGKGIRWHWNWCQGVALTPLSPPIQETRAFKQIPCVTRNASEVFLPLFTTSLSTRHSVFFLSKIVSIKEQEMWLWHFVLKCQLSLLIIIWLLFQNLLWSQSLRVAADSWKCWHRLSTPGMFSALPALSQARNAEKGPFLWFLCIPFQHSIYFCSSVLPILIYIFLNSEETPMS